jgi:hypothetical protein
MRHAGSAPPEWPLGAHISTAPTPGRDQHRTVINRHSDETLAWARIARISLGHSVFRLATAQSIDLSPRRGSAPVFDALPKRRFSPAFWGIVDGMSQKIPGPKDIKAAAQAAAETAQSVANSAMRIPPASIQLANQVPDLIENLATATERLNEAIDRAERFLALADPMLRTMDAVLPQLEALVATGNDVFTAVSSLPGVSTVGRFVNRGNVDASGRPKTTRRRSTDDKR